MYRFLCLLVTATLACGAAAVQQIPLESFASLPDVRDVALSPNGRYMVSSVRVDLKNVEGRAVSVVDLETGEQTMPLMAKNDTYSIHWIRWATNQYLLVSAMYPETRYHEGIGKSDTRETKLFKINVATGDVEPALSRRFLKGFEIPPFAQDNVLDILPDDEHFLLSMTGDLSGVTGMRRSLRPLVYKVSLEDRSVRTVQRPVDHVRDWGTDRQHRVRIAHSYQDTIHTIKTRDIDSDDWRTLWQFQAFSEDTVWPLGFGKDPNELYVRAYHEGLFAVFRVDLQDPELKKQRVFADPDYDVNGQLLYSHKRDKVVGIAYARHGGYVFWDEKAKAFQAAIDKALPETTNRIVSMSDDERQYVVLATSDVDSGTYYVGNRDTNKLKTAAFRYKNLPPELMSEKRTYNYEARDGLEIEAYLTVPKGSDGKKLPTLVFPHGGPISETTDGFSYWTQLFANRGYAVLEMNFRGSSGRGHAFMEAGLKNWGKQMQDDVQDGALKLIKEGIADPERICIVGASYGGYAALMGAVKTPDFYRCAASFAGVSDVNRLAKDWRSRHARKNIVDLQIGDDYSELKAVSPLHRAEAIDVPVLLVHGSADRQVPPEHSRKMHAELQSLEKDVTYLELDGGNHYLTNNDDRVATLKAFETFLAEHLQPVSKTAGAN